MSTSGVSRHSTATTNGSKLESAKYSACTTRCRGLTASSNPHDHFVVPRYIIWSRLPVPPSARRWAGSDRTSSHPLDARPSLNTPGVNKTGLLGSMKSSVPPASRWRSSTKLHSANWLSKAQTPAHFCSGSAPPTLTLNWVAWCIREFLMPVALTRPTSRSLVSSTTNTSGSRAPAQSIETEIGSHDTSPLTKKSPSPI